MKSSFFKAFLGIMLLSMGLQVRAQTFECRLAVNDMGYLVYQMRETSGINTPNTTSTLIADITFVIRWPEGMGVDNSLLCATNDYQIDDALGSKRNYNGYDYRYWYSNQGVPIYPPHDWIVNEWEDIAVFITIGGSGVTDFEIAPNFWNGTSLNWTQGPPLQDNTPTIVGAATNYTYPTKVYNYVWTGLAGGPPAAQNNKKWENTANWRGTCPGDAAPEGSYPYVGQSPANVVIPAGVATYPELSSNTDAWGWSCEDMVIEAGAHVTVPDLSTTNNASNPELYITGDLTVAGTLTLTPKGHMTVLGTTNLNAAEALVVQSTTAGGGSFIDNGTINYGTGGSAKVQTYVENNAVAPAFFMHFMAPTIQGMDLSGFIMAPMSTYAYVWDQPTGGWLNVTAPYAANPGMGFAISTIDGNDYTLESVGNVSTGNIASAVAYGGVGNYSLIGNPYPSSVDFDALAAANPLVYNKYYIYSPSAGAYVSRSAGVGAAQHIQVGQAFLVETTTAAGNFNFTNAQRSHSNDPYRDAVANVLELTAQGVGADYHDITYIHFREGATSGYDIDLDAEHFNSWADDATQLRTVAEDGSKLAINMLPALDLSSGQLVSVPMQFSCGYAGEYTITASQLESFDNGAEIWLEDKQNNDIWVNIGTNPVYSFNATPEDLADRFVVHFFGPTGIDNTYDPGINIFSYEHNAYVTTVGTEQITDITVYDLSGRIAAKPEISAGQQQYKIYVSDRKSYYVVRVTTDKSVFTEKVFIY